MKGSHTVFVLGQAWTLPVHENQGSPSSHLARVSTHCIFTEGGNNTVVLATTAKVTETVGGRLCVYFGGQPTGIVPHLQGAALFTAVSAPPVHHGVIQPRQFCGHRRGVLRQWCVWLRCALFVFVMSPVVSPLTRSQMTDPLLGASAPTIWSYEIQNDLHIDAAGASFKVSAVGKCCV